MKDKGTIVTGSVITNGGSGEEFNVFLPCSKNLDYLGPYSFDDLMEFIDENKPESVLLYTANMHGKSIIFVLERLMSRKYTPFIYDYMIHKFGRPRIIIIKFLDSNHRIHLRDNHNYFKSE